MTECQRFNHPGELADYLTAHSYCPGLDGTLRRAWATMGIWWAALASPDQPRPVEVGPRRR